MLGNRNCLKQPEGIKMENTLEITYMSHGQLTKFTA